MLRADVDQHVIAGKLRLHRRRRAYLEGSSAVLRYERNALWSSLRIEPGGRELDFYCAIA
jgi:hypothetical protein